MRQVKITKNSNGRTYDVGLITWEKSGEGMRSGIEFNVSKKEAEKEAQHCANLYNAEIIREA